MAPSERSEGRRVIQQSCSLERNLEREEEEGGRAVSEERGIEKKMVISLCEDSTSMLNIIINGDPFLMVEA